MLVHEQERRMRSCAGEAEDEDALCAIATCFTLELCVSFADTYRVPMLWLRARSAAGEPLPPRSLLAELGAEASDATITPAAWPHAAPHVQMIDGGQWLVLHPCQTRAAMRTLLAGEPPTPPPAVLRAYMRGWWSLAGAVVGAALPLAAHNERKPWS